MAQIIIAISLLCDGRPSPHTKLIECRSKMIQCVYEKKVQNPTGPTEDEMLWECVVEGKWK